MIHLVGAAVLLAGASACGGTAGGGDDGPTATEPTYEATLLTRTNPAGFTAPVIDPRAQTWFTPLRLPAVQANGQGEALLYYHRDPGGSGYVEIADGLRLFRLGATGMTAVPVSADFSHVSSVYFGPEGMALFDPQGFDYLPPSGVRTTIPTALTPTTPFNGQQSMGVGYVDASGTVYGWQMTHSTTFRGRFLWRWTPGQSGRRPEDANGSYFSLNPATGDTLYRFVNTYNRADPPGAFEQCPFCGQFGATLARAGTGAVPPSSLVPGATDPQQARIVGATPRGYVVVDVRSSTAAGVAYWQNGTRTPFPAAVTDAYSAAPDGDVVVLRSGAVTLLRGDGTSFALPTAALLRPVFGGTYRFVAAGSGIVYAYQTVDAQGNIAVYRLAPALTR
jgi:hypothetical protein